MNNPIHIVGDQRVLIVGKTGSGKTFLSRRFLSKFPRVLYFDALHRLDMPILSADAARRTIDSKDAWHICVDDADTYADLIFSNFDEGGFITYIDEVYSLAPPNKRTAIGHEVISLLWTRGRGNNIGAWGATQRPTWIPLVVLSESEHYFVFRLQLESDRKRMADIVGRPVERVIRDKHGFWYANTSDDVLDYYKQIGVKHSQVVRKQTK